MLEKITYKKALEMMREKNSQMLSMNRQEHLALHPKYMGNLKQGVTTMLDSFMSLYQNRFGGVPIAYNNVQMVQQKAANISDQPFLHFDIKADFIVFKPEIGSFLKGIIQKVEVDHVSCLVHGVFNAWFPKEPLLYVVKDTDPLSLMGSEVEFKVTKFSSSNGVLSLKGDFERILKRKLNNLSSSTPATNKKTFFDDEDQPDTPAIDLDQSFNPALTSTQLETPYAVNNRKKKRKLSEVMEDKTTKDDTSLPESGIGDIGVSEPKKKKKKHKQSWDMTSPINSDIGSSLVSDSQAEISTDGSSKHKKKKKKHSVDNNTYELSDKNSSQEDMAEGSSTQKSKKKPKLSDKVGTSCTITSDNNSYTTIENPFNIAGDNSKHKKKKKKQDGAIMNHSDKADTSSSIFSDGQGSQNQGDGTRIKAYKKHKTEKTNSKPFYSEMSPSPERDIGSTKMHKNHGKPHNKGLYPNSNTKRDNSVPTVNDFFKGFFDSMKVEQSSNKVNNDTEVHKKDGPNESLQTKVNIDDGHGKSKKKKHKNVTFNQTEMSASFEDFVSEKTQGKKKKKKKIKKDD